MGTVKREIYIDPFTDTKSVQVGIWNGWHWIWEKENPADGASEGGANENEFGVVTP